MANALQESKGDCSANTLCNDHGIPPGITANGDTNSSLTAPSYLNAAVALFRERLEHENSKREKTTGELTIQ